MLIVIWFALTFDESEIYPCMVDFLLLDLLIFDFDFKLLMKFLANSSEYFVSL